MASPYSDDDDNDNDDEEKEEVVDSAHGNDDYWDGRWKYFHCQFFFGSSSSLQTHIDRLVCPGLKAIAKKEGAIRDERWKCHHCKKIFARELTLRMQIDKKFV